MIRNEKGSTLVVVLLIITVVTVLGVTLLGSNLNSVKQTNQSESTIRVTHLAEMGITYAQEKLTKLIVTNNPNDATGLQNIKEALKVPISVGTNGEKYWIDTFEKKANTDNVFLFKSIGSDGKKEKSLLATITITPTVDGVIADNMKNHNHKWKDPTNVPSSNTMDEVVYFDTPDGLNIGSISDTSNKMILKNGILLEPKGDVLFSSYMVINTGGARTIPGSVVFGNSTVTVNPGAIFNVNKDAFWIGITTSTDEQAASANLYGNSTIKGDSYFKFNSLIKGRLNIGGNASFRNNLEIQGTQATFPTMRVGKDVSIYNGIIMNNNAKLQIDGNMYYFQTGNFDTSTGTFVKIQKDFMMSTNNAIWAGTFGGVVCVEGDFYVDFFKRNNDSTQQFLEIIKNPKNSHLAIIFPESTQVTDYFTTKIIYENHNCDTFNHQQGKIYVKQNSRPGEITLQSVDYK